ncbi:glycosyltransferase family 9 protein [Pelotalea chapellei]|uniref:Glycosyltransferase family 9 protein n=1 Tax=Pelotalea chapellei TaxID=44671 RepID=A0ABS5U7W5_9BACT|nr:glycosyltransferase family 9 protein [Pelotalea chapellei]MBT1071755.1 glycosyltransferase family 9 protein [Pelotalea chapellei]
MSILRDVINIIRVDGPFKGSSILIQRLYMRGAHLIILLLDVCQTFVRWYGYYLKSRRSGRRLVVITLIEHMGDIVACEPVANHVRAEEPNALILWCAKKSYGEIVRQFRGIDAVIYLGCLTSWIALRKWAHFDKVVDLHINGRSCHSCRIPLRKKEGDLRVTMENYYNYGSLLGAFCLSAGLPVLDGRPELLVPDPVVRSVDRFGLQGPIVVIHCCSNESCRDWTPSHWNELIETLHARYGVTVVEIGSESPLDRPESVQYRNLCGECSILESAEVIKRALLFIGIDSGPAHLANAVGTYGIILLGEYLLFRNYTPYSGAYANGSGASLLRAQGKVSLISVSQVLKTVEVSGTLLSGSEINGSLKNTWTNR